MKTVLAIAIVAAVMMASVAGFAHSGGTDANNCHYDHKNGGYHCH